MLLTDLDLFIEEFLRSGERERLYKPPVVPPIVHSTEAHQTQAKRDTPIINSSLERFLTRKRPRSLSGQSQLKAYEFFATSVSEYHLPDRQHEALCSRVFHPRNPRRDRLRRGGCSSGRPTDSDVRQP